MELKNNSNIKKNVMHRVHVVHTARPLMSGATAAILLLLLTVWGIGREVFVAQIFRNMPSIENLSATVHFLTSAFLNTRSVVQVLAVLMLVTTLWLAREIARLVAPTIDNSRQITYGLR